MRIAEEIPQRRRSEELERKARPAIGEVTPNIA